MIIASIYLCAVFIAFKWLPDTKEGNGNEGKKEKWVLGHLFRTMNPQIYVFCFIVFLQQFTTGPLWNTFVPLHFYVTFAVSSTFVGILMSLDELIGSPTSFLAGKVADRVSDRNFLSLSYIFAGISAVFLLFARTPIYFMVFFLICGLFVTCTQIVIPKSASGFMRNTTRGFEYAIISSCGGLGEWLGNLTLGKIMKESSLNYVVIIFFVSYIIISIISFLSQTIIA